MPGFKLYDYKRTVMLPVDSEQQNRPDDNRLHFTTIADPGFRARDPRFKTTPVTKSELPRAPKFTPNNASALPNFSSILPLRPVSVRPANPWFKCANACGLRRFRLRGLFEGSYVEGRWKKR
ncbi:hypothetical protein [Syntrophotalea carbinolica]|uniref:hypothetical protein n=1 Tax=Syntrophotalea carbinolica TaxID=19 RepID=UPI0005A0A3F8|nr:hypothetical protein [Syntrophotalea carbinolica]